MKLKSTHIFLITFVILVAFMLNMSLTGCVTAPVSQEPVVQAPVASGVRIALSWETNNPERKEWSDFVVKNVRENKKLYDAADMVRFCPKYNSLSSEQQVRAIGEFWQSLVYFESSYNPKSSSVDVGDEGNLDTYSVGLCQMSVVDQKNYGVPLGYKYADLLKPIPNLDLAMNIMHKKLAKVPKIILRDGVYWAVIRDGDSFVRRETFCASNPGVCKNSKWKTGWCAMQNGSCRLTVLPDVIARVKAKAPGCQ